MGLRDGLKSIENPAPTRIRFPDSPAHSKLSHPGQCVKLYVSLIQLLSV